MYLLLKYHAADELQGIFFFNFFVYSKHMKKIMLIILSLFLSGCSSITAPDSFVYKEIQTKTFKLASWQKITHPTAPYKIYIEGDGHAFNAHGQPTRNPTPKGTLVRELAFGDNHENVIYLARPCQYVSSPICSQRHWTTARFAPEVVQAEYEAVKQIAGNNPVVLVGFSGGAQIVGLIAATKPDLNVKKVVTIAGNLDHLAWTQAHNLPPLSESMNLESYQTQFKSIPQIHYVGSKDDVIPPELIRKFVGNENWIIEVDGAAHNTGWKSIYHKIWNEF